MLAIVFFPLRKVQVIKLTTEMFNAQLLKCASFLISGVVAGHATQQDYGLAARSMPFSIFHFGFGVYKEN